jgi:hypothetical protein
MVEYLRPDADPVPQALLVADLALRRAAHAGEDAFQGHLDQNAVACIASSIFPGGHKDVPA